MIDFAFGILGLIGMGMLLFIVGYHIFRDIKNSNKD
jgi:hypothetical protein